MIKKLFIFLIFSLIFTSCSHIQKEEINYKILSPKTDWIYFSDSPITFSTNLNTKEIQWFSDIDGFLGSGNAFKKKLSSGTHTIKTFFHGNEKILTIYVEERVINSGQTIRRLINSNEQCLQLPEGIYKPALLALEGSIDQASIRKINKVDNTLKKDIKINSNLKNKKIIQHPERTVNKTAYKLNEKKTFYVINTKNQTVAPHEITAKLLKTSSLINFWYPVNPQKYSSIMLDDGILNSFLEEIENVIIPRLNTLWGKLPDIDNDGKISFLFTPTINEEECAVGFFNPEDFYKRDASSPFSNEMDILYIAIPEVNNFSYSTKCICSTIAHELTHAINYNIKTYSRFLNNFSTPPQEETFLDEALAHLSESLCGYGISGGNVSILFYYLNNLEKYSVCKNDYLENSDSNGRRAAATMFLSWLFWKKGGISWNPNEPVEIIDNGGIAFVQELVASEESGWENIGKIFGKNTDSLYIQMIEELNAQRENTSPSIIDPYSKEVVQVYPDFRRYYIEEFEKSWILAIPQLDLNSSISLLPYSFVLFAPCSNEFSVQLKSSNIEGQVLSLFSLD